MESYNIILSDAINQTISNLEKYHNVLAFRDSIRDKNLKKFLLLYPKIRAIAEHSLQIGNIRRVEKYYALLKRIEMEISKKHTVALKELEDILLND